MIPLNSNNLLRSSKSDNSLSNVLSQFNKLVIKKIDEDILDERILVGVLNKTIPGEQWFRRPENWYSITAYTNPYKTPYSELKILFEHSKELVPLINKTLKIFYGVGIADSETLIISWDLGKTKYSEVCAIDVANDFLTGFIQSLRNLVLEYPSSKIMFKGYNNIFEEIKKEDLNFYNSRYTKSTYVCFGNTIGNYFNQKEIFDILTRSMKRGDFLLIGFQLCRNPKKILTQYSKNLHFEKFILDSLKFVEKNKKLKWKFNQAENRVEAWFGDILAFQSKKYDLKEFLKFTKKLNLTPIKVFEDNEFAVVLLRKENQ